MGASEAFEDMPIACGFSSTLAACADGAQPDEALSVDEWAEQYMVIPKDTGAAEPGPYRLDRTPYAREVMRCLSADHPCRRVVVRAASQMLKTQVALNWLASIIDQTPANVLVLLPTERLTKRVSGRIAKTIKAVDRLRDKVAPERSRDARNTIDTKEFPGGSMYIVTAGSAANLAEIPARFVYADEVDRWPTDVDGEGDPASLAEKRTSTFAATSKVYYSSSPTTEGESAIDALMAQSTCRQYQVPCPHCDEMQVLDPEYLRCSEDLSRAWMVCRHCGTEIEERAKAAMLPAGEWVATSAGDGRTEGFELNALYAPLGWVSWLDLARERAHAKAKEAAGDTEAMQVLANTRWARSYKVTGEKLDDERIKDRAEDYELLLVPAGGFVLTMSVDVQNDRLEYAIVAWGRGEESWLVDYDKIYGDPGQEVPGSVWERLDEIRARTIAHASGQQLRVEACAIDSGGHHTHQVYAYCRTREHQRVFAIKGDTDVKAPIKGRARMMDVNLRGKILKHGVRLWFVGVHVAKDLLAGRFRLAQPGPGYIHLPKAMPDDYWGQLTAEQRVWKRTAHGGAWRWVKVNNSARNEGWDLWVYCLWAAHAIDLHKYRAAQWDRLEQMVAPRQGDLLSGQPIAPAKAAVALETKVSTRPSVRSSALGSDDWSARL